MDATRLLLRSRQPLPARDGMWVSVRALSDDDGSVSRSVALKVKRSEAVKNQSVEGSERGDDEEWKGKTHWLTALLDQMARS
jgi:hypothetical protein